MAERTVSGRLAELDVRLRCGDERAHGGHRLQQHEARVRRLQRERVARVRHAQLLHQPAPERERRLLCEHTGQTSHDTSAHV